MIEISELYKYYGDRRAVGPVTATIDKGEIVGLLGLNGAGKTTTLRVLACDLLPTSGTVRVGGIDVVESPHEVRKKVGYLPDTPPVYPEMTVEEYLVFAAKLRGVGAAQVQKRVGEALELTQTAVERSTPIFALSHGFRQRVGIAQAIVHRPEFVVLDEPISGLDPVQIVEMRDLVRGLGGEHTVVVSSHILSEISETCDRIFVIRDGEIVASGSEAELSSRFLRGMRLEVTLRAGDGLDAALEAMRAVSGVTSVEHAAVPSREPRAVDLTVTADGDVREELSRALVGAGHGLLELRRGERELESVFLELSRSAGTAARKKVKKKPAPEPIEEAP
ncbi:MAG: ABC transporter ATP-binding protein [Polyangiaceae bacterium]|nr:ABC transporter ATP-binding protein [Polyangiaceae bacterium]